MLSLTVVLRVLENVFLVLMSRLNTSINVIAQNTLNSDVYIPLLSRNKDGVIH